MKIVSLVPSLTELLFYLGLENQVVGRTKFCIHPADKIKDAVKIGGTKNVNIQKVIDLQPDLVLANKEENTKADIEALQKTCNVHVTEIANFKQAIFAIDDIGLITKTSNKATLLIEQIEDAFRKIEPLIEKKKVCYLIWQNPYMSIGNDTYIHDMMKVCGFENICSESTRYPQLTITNIKEHKPDFIFLSSEPFPFKEKHIEELERIFPEIKVVLVDGEYFSWYGSRMLDAAGYFRNLVDSL